METSGAECRFQAIFWSFLCWTWKFRTRFFSGVYLKKKRGRKFNSGVCNFLFASDVFQWPLKLEFLKVTYFISPWKCSSSVPGDHVCAWIWFLTKIEPFLQFFFWLSAVLLRSMIFFTIYPSPSPLNSLPPWKIWELFVFKT